MEYAVVWGLVLVAVVVATAVIFAVRREPWKTVSRAYPCTHSSSVTRRKLFCSASINLSRYLWSLRFAGGPGGLQISRLFWPGGFCVPWRELSVRHSRQPNTVGRELLFERCNSVQILVSERLGAAIQLWKETFEEAAAGGVAV